MTLQLKHPIYESNILTQWVAIVYCTRCTTQLVLSVQSIPCGMGKRGGCGVPVIKIKTFYKLLWQAGGLERSTDNRERFLFPHPTTTKFQPFRRVPLFVVAGTKQDVKQESSCVMRADWRGRAACWGHGPHWFTNQLWNRVDEL